MGTERDAPGLSTRTGTSLLEGLRDTGDVGHWEVQLGVHVPIERSSVQLDEELDVTLRTSFSSARISSWQPRTGAGASCRSPVRSA